MLRKKGFRFYLYVFINIFLLAFFAVYALPSFNVALFGKNIYFPSLDIEAISGGYLFNSHTRLTSDFVEQEVYVIDFSENVDITDEEESVEEDVFSENDFDYNLKILRQRLNILNLSDYSVRKVLRDGKYLAEITVPRGEDDFRTALGSILNSGSISIYEDIEGFSPPDRENEQFNFDFLEGKQLSANLSLDDIESVKHYLYTNSNNVTVYVVRLEFGVDSIDQVAQASSPTFSTNVSIPGLMLVSQDFPIAIQAEAVAPPTSSYSGQSYIMFTTLFGDPNSYLQTKALAANILTESLMSSGTIVDTRIISANFQPYSVEFSKISLLVGIILLSLFTMIFYKGFVGISIVLGMIGLSIVVVGFINLFSITLGGVLIVTLNLILYLGWIFIVYFMGVYSNNKKIGISMERFLRARSVFLIGGGITTVFLSSVFWFVSYMYIINIIGFIIGIIAIIYCLYMLFPLLLEYRNK